VSASVGQVQRVLDQVIRAVEFLFGFTLVAGLVVLFAAVSATREARAREFAVMRAMGAGAGCCAGAAGRAAGRGRAGRRAGVGGRAGRRLGLARYAFEFSWSPSPWVPLVGALAGALLALAAGWWGLREVLRQPVLQTLRRAGAV
jgi:putative ABC transport system permease protein